MAKYGTIKELAEAFSSGELDREQYVLVLDNDCSFLQFKGPNPHPEDSDDYYCYQDRMNDAAHELFEGNGYSDLLDACEAAGIPAEWC